MKEFEIYWEFSPFYRRMNVNWKFPLQSIKNIWWGLYPIRWVVESHEDYHAWDYFWSKESAIKHVEDYVLRHGNEKDVENFHIWKNNQ